MSGATIPYHLRQNKAIERGLFFDLLTRVGRQAGFNISDYHYVGFGGPFMEDFKHVHAALRIGKMTCIERSAEVVKRQKFNHPIAGISYFEGLSGDFVTNFVREEKMIVWLDYTNLEIREQLLELSDLVSKLAHGDIFKITLNAHPNKLETLLLKPGDPQQLPDRRQSFEKRIGDLAPVGLVDLDFSLQNYPKVLNKSVSLAIDRASVHKSCAAISLASFVYKDGQQMFTMTGIVLDRDLVNDFLENTRIASWPFAGLKWADPQRIQVPDLSIKERQLLEGLLPVATSNDLAVELGYGIQEDANDSLALLESLRIFYRFMPQYGRVAF